MEHKFINRDWSRTEHDDWILNIQPLLSQNKESVPVYYKEKIIGWNIHFRYE